MSEQDRTEPDDREALRGVFWTHVPSLTIEQRAGVADAIIAAGFRRHPEPSSLAGSVLAEVERRLRDVDGYAAEDARRTALLHIDAYHAGRARFPEPVKPSREDVARALYLADAGPNLASVAAPAWDNAPNDHAVRRYWLDQADAVLALWPGRSVAEVKAEALREFADAHRFPPHWVMFRRDDETGVTVSDLLREVADRIERGES